MAANNKSLFSWPANPTLTGLQLIARVALVMTNAIGLSVSYAAGVRSNQASFWVAAAFMTASLILFEPIFMVWNKRQLRRSRMAEFNDDTITQELRSALSLSPSLPVSAKFLVFAIVMDTVGALGYWIVWGFTLHDAVNGGYLNYYYSVGGETTLKTYASAATLTCALIHSLLLATQLLQYLKARRVRSTHVTVCPHCHHSLNDLTASKTGRTSHVPSPVMTSAEPEESQNLLGRDSYEDDRQTVVDMAPGQETGTCTKTPRVSTSSNLISTDDSGAANETERSENDRLMEKSE